MSESKLIAVDLDTVPERLRPIAEYLDHAFGSSASREGARSIMKASDEVERLYAELVLANAKIKELEGQLYDAI